MAPRSAKSLKFFSGITSGLQSATTAICLLSKTLNKSFYAKEFAKVLCLKIFRKFLTHAQKLIVQTIHFLDWYKKDPI